MKKLYRTTLFAGVLAFGLAACGDDVELVEPTDPPPPTLTATFSPQSVNVAEGQTADLGLNISGGVQGAAQSWTCVSGNTDVATASETAAGCRVTGVSAGSTTVTAEVTKGTQTATASAGVTVAELTRASVEIAELRQGGTTADIDNISGQLDVVLNIRAGDETPTQVDVIVTDDEGNETVVASQVFTTEEIAEMMEAAEAAAESPEVAEQVATQITLSFRTDRYDIEDGVANIWHLNGDKTISAELHVAQNGDGPRASNVVHVVFNNSDGFHVLGTRPENSALDGNGRRWYGGNSGDVEITAIPVFYSGLTAQSVNLSFCSSSELLEESPFEHAFACANYETDLALHGTSGEVPVINSQYADSGDDGPTTILNTDHPFPVRIDNLAPVAVEDEEGDALTVFTIVRQSGLLNVGNWLNHQYAFKSGFRSANVTDGGVGRPAADAGVDFQVSEDRDGDDIVYGPNGGIDLVAGDIGLEETVTNTALVAWVQVCDRLTNCRLFPQEIDVDEDHPLGTFGYDETAPGLELRTDDMGVFEEQYSIVNMFDEADDIISLRGTDVASGFAPIGEGLAFSRGLVAVGSQFDQPESPTRTSLVGANAVAAPFGTIADGGLVNTLHSIMQTAERDGEAFNLIQQTAIEYTWTLGNYIQNVQDVIEDDPRYWIYQVRLRDRAGNVTTDYRATLHNWDASPMIEAITRGAGFPDDPAFVATYTQDDLELFEASIGVAYPETHGQLIWERPSAEISSVLRMEAAIEDGMPFTDYIQRPHRNLGLPLGFENHGLPFVKNVQVLGGGTNNTKPTMAAAQVYNGWPLEATGIIHGSNVVGQSPLTTVGIPAEEVADATVDFTADTDIADWRIDDSSAADCDNFCARLLGPSGTFSLPVLRDGVLIVWTDESAPGDWRVLTIAEPNFSGEFPTRDDGVERMYEWTFSGGVEGFDGDVLYGAIAVNSHGDALLASQEAAEPQFNVRFAVTPQELENEATNSVTFEVIHGVNSTGDAFTVDACQWIDENGNVLTTAPTGLTLSQDLDGNCVVTTDGTADIDEEHLIRANVTRDATGETDTAIGTVVVIAPEFTVELSPADVTVEVPATGSVTQTFTLGDDMGVPYTAGDISAYSCSLSGNTTGVSVAEDVDGANLVCEVTVTSDASAGSVGVNVNATEAGTGQTDSDQATLNLEEVVLSLDPVSTVDDPTEIDWLSGVDIFVIASGSRESADIDDVASTCTIDPATGMDATFGLVNGDPACTITVTDPTAVAEDDEFEVDFTIEWTADARVDEITGHAFLGEQPEFAPVFDIQTTADNRREIERDRTANFIVIDGEGLGIDLAATNATVTVSPQNDPLTAADVTAEVVLLSGDVVLQVTVPATANTGNYNITLTFHEDGTTNEHDEAVFIRVIDTGTMEPGF